MAHTITTQVIVDGRRITVVKINIKGDSGTAAELTKAIIFDASAYYTGSTYNKLMEIEYDLNGFSAELFWNASSDIPLMSLAKDHPTKEEFWEMGGLVNNGATGRTGDILITTNGLSSSTKDGHIVLYLAQRNTNKLFI
jgi:hypothetical protein